MNANHAFLFFHCNLAFSSIEEETRGKVIDKCYFPMLELASKHDIPIGIEVTGWTLEQIAVLRPHWIEQLKELMAKRKVSFIGSGYSQMIGPLVPAKVNAANQRIGQEIYEQLLGHRPILALINEQAYSHGVLEHYLDAGYTGIIMEWDNPSLSHKDWGSETRYQPQCVRDARGRELHLLWNQSVIFQQVQRYVHGDIEGAEFLKMMERHSQGDGRVLCIYGNDAEVFDFRPGRFTTEAVVQENEWKRLAEMLIALKKSQYWQYVLPEKIVELVPPQHDKYVSLESSQHPILVKKQPKYNLLRWAVTGRADFFINTRCHRLYSHLKKNNIQNLASWKELCYLWSSDFRTHITQKRWIEYQERLLKVEKQWLGQEAKPTQENTTCSKKDVNGIKSIELTTPFCRATVNTYKGIAVQSLSFIEEKQAQFVTLPHGFFEDINYAADFFTGHVVMEAPGERKRADLCLVQPIWKESETEISVEAQVQDFYCPLHKRISVSKLKPECNFTYTFDFDLLPPSAIRLFHITLHPDAFDQESLFYATHNGGFEFEKYSLAREVNHSKPISFLVSASDALGMTEGIVVIGDNEKSFEITVDMAQAAVVAMVVHKKIGEQWLTRLIFSCREFDDTSKISHGEKTTFNVAIRSV